MEVILWYLRRSTGGEGRRVGEEGGRKGGRKGGWVHGSGWVGWCVGGREGGWVGERSEGGERVDACRWKVKEKGRVGWREEMWAPV